MLVALFEWMPARLKRWVCGYLAPGHSYTMQMIRMDGSECYVLDPFTTCKHCELPLPDSVLLKLVEQIEHEDVA